MRSCVSVLRARRADEQRVAAEARERESNGPSARGQERVARDAAAEVEDGAAAVFGGPGAADALARAALAVGALPLRPAL
jgi:hypothetical protein